MINIAICDDEKKIVGKIEDLIWSYSDKKQLDIYSVEGFYSGSSLLQYIDKNNTKYDIIFLDIKIGVENGIKIANSLRKNIRHKDSLIVIVSSYSQYMKQAFSIDALEYIVKPIREKEITDLLDKCFDKFSIQAYFRVHTNSSLRNIHVDRLMYGASKDKYVYLCLEGEPLYPLKVTKEALLKKFSDDRLILVHQSYFVNIDYIRSYSTSFIIMEDGASIPISRRKKDSVKQYIYQFLERKNTWDLCK